MEGRSCDATLLRPLSFIFQRVVPVCVAADLPKTITRERLYLHESCFGARRQRGEGDPAPYIQRRAAHSCHALSRFVTPPALPPVTSRHITGKLRHRQHQIGSLAGLQRRPNTASDPNTPPRSAPPSPRPIVLFFLFPLLCLLLLFSPSTSLLPPPLRERYTD